MIVRRWGARTRGNPQLLQSSVTRRGASEGGKAPGRAPGSVRGREGPGGFASTDQITWSTGKGGEAGFNYGPMQFPSDTWIF